MIYLPTKVKIFKVSKFQYYIRGRKQDELAFIVEGFQDYIIPELLPTSKKYLPLYIRKSLNMKSYLRSDGFVVYCGNPLIWKSIGHYVVRC